MAHIHAMTAFHFDRRQLRRTARATLVVWLFALATGVVNACALTPAGQSGSGGVHADVAVHGSHHDKGERVDQHGHEHDSGRDNCLKFCDDESSAIAKVKLPVVDLGSSPAIVAEPWNPAAATGRVGPRLSSERRGTHGPPLVIRFLRLTL